MPLEPRPILSVDFKEQREQENLARANELSVAAYKVFSSPDGKRVLDYLKQRTEGRLIETNVHQTVANAAKRDLIDEIEELMRYGLERVST